MKENGNEETLVIRKKLSFQNQTNQIGAETKFTPRHGNNELRGPQCVHKVDSKWK